MVGQKVSAGVLFYSIVQLSFAISYITSILINKH